VACVPWSSAQHSIRAAAATPENAALLVVERQTWNADLPVTHVRFTYPGDSHALVARFTPSQG
jgi:GntR family histidine utilization transcriptional repressor